VPFARNFDSVGPRCADEAEEGVGGRVFFRVFYPLIENQPSRGNFKIVSLAPARFDARGLQQEAGGTRAPEKWLESLGLRGALGWHRIFENGNENGLRAAAWSERRWAPRVSQSGQWKI